MTLGERIRSVRRAASQTQKEFSSALGVSGNYVYLIESDREKPSDRTLNDIARIYGVNKTWLEEGSGEPYIDKTESELIAEFLGNALSGVPESESKRKFIAALAKMDQGFWDAIERFEDKLLEEQLK